MKLLLWPSTDMIEPNHGIGRIVHAQYKYLPEHGIEFVFDAKQADVIATHTQMDEVPYVDVLHLHGIYWTGEPQSGKYVGYHNRANEKIMVASRRAQIITVPSAWTAMPFRRDMRLVPAVLGHGIDFAEWEPGQPKGYMLWNKNRNTDVCDPTPAWELSQRGIQVVSTFAPQGVEPGPKMTVLGALPHEQMKILVANADVYLATVKETYGIGTVEALACGVPVLGYAHGGTADIVQHKFTGYLAKPGDLDDLQAGYEYIMENRAELSENARAFAASRDWSMVIPEYVQVYEAALQMKQSENTKVSIVITNYNYAKYLPEAVESAVTQTLDCEVVVVDDGSTDNSRDVLQRLSDRFPIRVVAQANQGVAAARNAGITAATGGFIICLDADDRLDSRYAGTLRNALAADRGVGVAYTGLGLIGENGHVTENVGWPPPFTWANQSLPGVPPNTCIPSASMFRKSMWERAGGIKQEYAPGEDTEFWTRGLSVGFQAVKVVDEPLFHYRAHAGSASRTKQYIPIDAFLPWMRDKQYPMAAPVDQGVPLIRSYSTPKVSVIIPVSQQHIGMLPRALDSVLGQTMREWEVVLVDDTEEGLPAELAATYPFVSYVQTSDSRQAPRYSSASSRNLGLRSAQAPLTLFLDADDYLMPEALSEMCDAYTKSGGRYIYTDWVALHSGKADVEAVPDYDPMAVMHAGQHAVTVLMATEDARRVGFDEDIIYLEDWDFFARCAIAGIQGKHLSKPLVAVTIHDKRKTTDLSKDPALFEKVAHMVFDRLEDYREGKKDMGGCCGGNGDALLAAKEAAFGRQYPVTDQELPLGQIEPGVVRMEYVGGQMGGSFYGGPGTTASGRRYKGGKNSHDRFIDAAPEDVNWLENSGNFRRVVQPQAQVPPSSQESVMETLARIAAKPGPATVMPTGTAEDEFGIKDLIEKPPALPPVEEEIPEGALVLTSKKHAKKKAKNDADRPGALGSDASNLPA